MEQLFTLVCALIIVMYGTYEFYRRVGGKSSGLVMRADERNRWISSQNSNSVKMLNIASIFGTLTAFSTVFMFYLGGSRLFGIFILAPFIAFYLSHYITNKISRRLAGVDGGGGRDLSELNGGAILPSLFWRADRHSTHASIFVKWMCLASIFGIVWLEFAVLTDFVRLVVDLGFVASLIVLFIIAYSVIWFTVSFGIRGFVVGDLFQAPVLIGAFVIISAASIGFYFSPAHHSGSSAVEVVSIWTKVFSTMQPIVPVWIALIFVVHVFALNLFLPVVFEAHWLRMWIFRESEIVNQRTAMFVTVLVTFFLVVPGFLIFQISGGLTFNEAVAFLVRALSEMSPFFAVVFWVAAAAALFSTADSQIYAGLMLLRFNPRSGQCETKSLSKPPRVAFAGSLVFCCIYALVRHYEIPFDKLAFFVVPLSIVMVPPIVDLALGREHVSRVKMYAALAGYVGISGIGLIFDDSLFSSLFAAIIPVAIALPSLVKLFRQGDRV